MDKLDKFTKLTIAIIGLIGFLGTGLYTAFQLFDEIKDGTVNHDNFKKEIRTYVDEKIKDINTKIEVLEHRSDSRMKRGEAYRIELTGEIKSLQKEVKDVRIKLGF